MPAHLLHIGEALARSVASQKRYFGECHDEIARRNLMLLRTICWFGIAFYLVTFAATWAFAPDMLISPLYALVIPAAGLLLLYIRSALHESPFNARMAQYGVLTSYAVLMAYVIVLSVFPHPDVPSVYFPLFVVMAPVIFILPAWQNIGMTLVSLASFIVLSLVFKQPTVWPHELFEAVVAGAFSVIVSVLMTQFQLQTDSLKNHYLALSRTDRLTGLLNKASGLASFQQYLDQRRPSEPCCLLFLDIDQFKGLNDAFGHLEGDRLLAEAGNAILGTFRASDIVCRFGGDEFMVVLKDAGSSAGMAKAQELNERIRQIAMPDGTPLACSIGVCASADDTLATSDFINRADRALYQVKGSGRGNVVLYDAAAFRQEAPAI